VIRTFRCKDTAAIFSGARAPKFGNIQQRAREKLRYLHYAADIRDLRMPPGNRLESLSGKRAGQWSIRINDQWRICFRWESGHAHDVEIVDYH